MTEKLKPVGIGRTAEVLTWDEGRVIKLYYDWCPDDWAEYEARIATIVQDGGVPCPSFYGLERVNGRIGLIYERITGPTLTTWMAKHPWKVRYVARSLAELHFKMHNLPVPGLPAQRERLIRKITSAKPLSQGQRDKAIQVLRQLPDDNRLCHGDFHPENVLLSEKGPVIIDWVDSTSGNPLADVGRTALLVRSGYIPPEMPGRRLILVARKYFHNHYLATYSKLSGAQISDIRAWDYVLVAGRLDENIPNEQETLLSYLG